MSALEKLECAECGAKLVCAYDHKHAVGGLHFAGMRIVADRDLPGDELRMVNDAGVIVARIKLLPPTEPT